jgi:hypothetical protein
VPRISQNLRNSSRRKSIVKSLEEVEMESRTPLIAITPRGLRAVRYFSANPENQERQGQFSAHDILALHVTHKNKRERRQNSSSSTSNFSKFTTNTTETSTPSRPTNTVKMAKERTGLAVGTNKGHVRLTSWRIPF